MNWIRENKFWSSIIAVLVVLAGITGYVYYSTPLNEEGEKVGTAIRDLTSKVQESQGASDVEAPIPSNKLLNRLKEEEQVHKKDIGKLAEQLLHLGKGIERWFAQKRFPNPGFFESIYQEEREKMTSRMNQVLSPVEQDQESSFLGGGGDEDEQRVEWPSDPAENMQQAQKQFWIIKRLVQDMIAAEAVTFQGLSFADQPDPVTVMDGQPFLQRYLVSCDVILPPEKIGYFLARQLQVDTGEDNTPDLMMHVRNYRLIKRRTTPQILDGLIGQNEGVRFTYPSEISEDLEGWRPGKKDLPSELHQPSAVKLEIDLTVYDPYEPTIVSLLREAGYENEQLTKVFQPFYTEQEFNGFVNGKN